MLTKREKSWLKKHDEAIAINPIDQAKAWSVIFDLCRKHNIIKPYGKPALVEVCEFIVNNVPKKSTKNEKTLSRRVKR